MLLWFNLFLEARAETLKKNLIGILVQTMTVKGHFEINWPVKSTKNIRPKKFWKKNAKGKGIRNLATVIFSITA